ncbi:hypothetical protein D3C78_1213540 [compost metagenome]
MLRHLHSEVQILAQQLDRKAGIEIIFHNVVVIVTLQHPAACKASCQNTDKLLLIHARFSPESQPFANGLRMNADHKLVDQLDNRAAAAAAHMINLLAHRLKHWKRSLKRLLIPADHNAERSCGCSCRPSADWRIQKGEAARCCRLV